MFKGSNVALITPFKDNILDEESYIKIINFHLENGTNGLVPVGTTGESPTLSHDEHQKVIELCIKESNGKLPVIAGFGIKDRRDVENISDFTDGVVVGSSIVNIIKNNLLDKSIMLNKIDSFTKELKKLENEKWSYGK